MAFERQYQKKPVGVTSKPQTPTRAYSSANIEYELLGAIGNREMGRLMETQHQNHPSSLNPNNPGEMPLLGGMMPISQGRIQRQPLFRGLSEEMRLENATLALPESGAAVQRKLTLGIVGDVYEQEADRVARQVVDEIHSSPFRASDTTSEGESIADDGEPGRVQRQITVRAAGDAGGELSSEWEGELQRAKGGGQPLSPQVRDQMGKAFGADFGGVRVHTGEQADMLARSIQAKAFTTGQDVFFRQGAYEPGSRGGQELLAHELTHVMQQRRNARVMRLILFEAGTFEGPFYRGINNNVIMRPNWEGPVTNMNVGVGTSRNHIIPYSVIGDALVNQLNQLYWNLFSGYAPLRLYAETELRRFTDSLNPNIPGTGVCAQNYMMNMSMTRERVIDYLNRMINPNQNVLPVTAQQVQNEASNLERQLYNAPHNVRVGNAQRNASIGANGIDADYAGIWRVSQIGNINQITPENPGNQLPELPPAGWHQNGLQVRSNGNIENLQVGNRFYVMTPTSNRIVYKTVDVVPQYIERPLAIIRNDGANIVPGITLNAPVTSGDDPGGAVPVNNVQVIVFDPDRQDIPYCFG